MPPRRNRRIRESTIWAAVAAAIVAHVAVIGTVSALGLSFTGARHDVTHTARRAADVPDLAATCAGDVVLATSGRTALCFAPWVARVDDCLADAQMSLWIDLSSCDARNDPGTAITMVTPKSVDKLAMIDPERLLEDARRDEQKPPPPPPPQVAAAQPPPPPPPPPQQRAQQVIETVKPSEEKEPDNARFVSEFNTKADKEKVSRGARNEPMVAKAKPEALTPKDKAADEPAVKPRDPDRVVGMNDHAPDNPGKLSMRNPGALAPALAEQEAKVRGAAQGASGADAADGYLARKGDGSIAQDRQDRAEVARGDSGAGGGTPEAPLLRPSKEVLERALGGGSVDNLENVEDADETSLSSKRWIYASFFNRLKRQVAQNWDPISVWRRVDPRGSVYGVKTRFTSVRVSLTRTGELDKIMVIEPSGIAVLDDEAVRAFRSSGPFPNPPEGLVQKDNLITFSFGFSFGIGAPKLSWRLPTAM